MATDPPSYSVTSAVKVVSLSLKDASGKQEKQDLDDLFLKLCEPGRFKKVGTVNCDSNR